MGRWTLINVVATVALIAALACAATLPASEPWREHQRRYLELVAERGSEAEKAAFGAERPRPHEVSIVAQGALDRCTTCHLGMIPGAPAFEGEGPLGAHPGGLLESHPVGRFGCTSCHGGQGRALDPERAHDRRHGGGQDAFAPPGVRCARCHAAAGLEGTALVGRGVAAYLDHGCSGCHQPGRPGPGIGPSLESIGLRGGSYIREVLLSPEKVYPQTIMPPLRYKVSPGDHELNALVAFLRTLEPWPASRPRRERRFDARSCTGCHRVADPRDEPTGPGHDCLYLHDEADWLSCSNCHGERRGPFEAACPVPDLPTPAGLTDGGDGAAVRGSPLESESVTEALRRSLETAAGLPAVSDPSGSCPHIAEAMSACGLCHRDGER